MTQTFLSPLDGRALSQASVLSGLTRNRQPTSFDATRIT